MTISQTTLKNAAKAIEHDLWTDPSTQANYLVKDGAILGRWEPEHDDGDALRLAVKLSMRIYIYAEGGDDCTCVANDELNRNCNGAIEERHGDDADAATRRAIVRAAAQVGESLCQ